MVESCTVNMVERMASSPSASLTRRRRIVGSQPSTPTAVPQLLWHLHWQRRLRRNLCQRCQQLFGLQLGGGFGIVAGNANNCSGTSTTGGDGIAAGIATGCYGESDAGPNDGVYASYLANGCYGYSESGTGVNAFIASVCYGSVNSGTALSTLHNVNSFSF